MPRSPSSGRPSSARPSSARPDPACPRRVVVCGDVINDLLVKPLDGREPWPDSDTPATILAQPGGAAANQAAWMAHLGADVVFAGRAGARDVAYHRRELARAGVRAHLAADREAETALWLLGEARARELAVTVDPGSAAFLARMEPAAFLRWTEGAAVCFPNRDEAAVLTGEPDPLSMAARLTRHYGVVVVKLGGAGCVLATPGEAPVLIAPHPALATDTTGAGDAFCGAFMSRWLAGSPAVDLAGAARFAVRVAATVVSRFGARPV